MAVKGAINTKVQYAAAVAQANTLLNEVAKNGEWKRFNSPEMVGPLQTALSNLTSVATSDKMVPRILSEEMKDLKPDLVKKIGEPETIVCFQSFSKVVNPLAAAVTLQAKSLLASKLGIVKVEADAADAASVAVSQAVPAKKQRRGKKQAS